MALREYRAKRDFKVTGEPRPARKSTKGASLFVIQKHAASHLHYDFRLELGGFLKSWAVPKGPPFAHEEKRLAMQVEDHPLDYARFEGIIPEGEYGGGTVMVWDIGTWEPLSENPAGDLEHGKLHFILHGKKLEGEWRLIRMNRDGRDKEWLLIRNGPSLRPLSKKRDDESALTGRSMKQIAAARDAEWTSRPADKKAAKPNRPAKFAPLARDLSSRFIAPMMAKLVDHPPAGDWLYEVKWDGYRAIGIKGGNDAILLSRNDKDLTGKFPEIAEALAKLHCREAILDGEIVALDAKGRSSFQLLQDYQLNASRPPLAWYVFDLLAVDGKDLTQSPLAERKKRLAALLKDAPDIIRPSPALDGAFDDLIAQVRKHGVEGLVGKLASSKYEPGRRSGAWIKVKVLNEQEFVVGGFTPPGGSRKHFGALLVGYYEGKKLLFASKVGTGYSEAVLRAVRERMKPLEAGKCPFANLPTKRTGRWGQGITRSEMGKCTWLEPRLVCQVRFTEWTRDGGLRHPAFLGLREDKAAEVVIRESKA
jgi:bifunctional non-homologous end joining protein LigD